MNFGAYVCQGKQHKVDALNKTKKRCCDSSLQWQCLQCMQTLSGPSLHSVTRRVLLVPSCSLTAEASFLWPLTLCVHTLQSRGLVAMSGQLTRTLMKCFPDTETLVSVDI